MGSFLSMNYFIGSKAINIRLCWLYRMEDSFPYSFCCNIPRSMFVHMYIYWGTCQTYYTLKRPHSNTRSDCQFQHFCIPARHRMFQMKQGRKTPSCEWVVFIWSLRSFVDPLKIFLTLYTSQPLKCDVSDWLTKWVTNGCKSLSCNSQLKREKYFKLEVKNIFQLKWCVNGILYSEIC